MQFSSVSKRIGLAILIPAMALAFFEPLPARADGVDDPNAGVARISAVSGTVAIERGDSQTTVAAVANAPVLGADYITTGEDGRAEIQFDGRSAVRLGEDVQMRFTRVDNGAREMQLAQGAIEVRLIGGVDGTTSIDTPSITVHPQESGAYRVTVTTDGTTQVTIRSGRADIETPQGNQTISAGTTLVANGPASSPQITSTDPIALDGFDEYNHQLDVNEERVTAAAPYVNSDIQGVSDLNQNGRWVDDGSYGNVWIPANVAPDWAPYRLGRWAWEDGYGYTWVAAEPWGWAPYHYGRWYHSASYGWAWYPPAPRVYTAWSPALVGFIGFGGGGGFGGGIGVNFAFGNVGWVPLAPHEAFEPWWGRGRGGGNYYNNSTHITNVTNINNNYYGNRRSITNVYQNARYANAVTGQSSQNFTRGNFTRNVAISQTQLGQGRAVRGALPIVPSQANLRYSDRQVPAALASRPALASSAFAGRGVVAQRTPFEAQRSTFATAQHLRATPASLTSTSTERLAPAAVQQRGAQFTPNANRPFDGQAAGVNRSSDSTTRNAGNANTPWDRFGASRSPASNTRLNQRGTAPAEGATARQLPQGNAIPSYSRSASANDPWARYGQNRGTAPAQGANAGDTQRAYPNAQRTYPNATQRAYPNASERAYPNASERAYPNASQRSYPSATQRTYPSATQRTYPNASQRSYPQQQRSYPQQQPAYQRAAPQQQQRYTAPARPAQQSRPPASDDRHPH